MATIVILEHLLQQGSSPAYLIHLLAERWRGGGHRVLIHHGPDNPPSGDVAILHIDLSVVPAEYRSLISRYPRVINGAVVDISKSSFSQNLVDRNTDWNGPVIVKTNANAGGKPEYLLLIRANQLKIRSEIPVGPLAKKYPVYASAREVPENYWEEPGIIIEKFLPERDERGYYMCVWIFFGDRETNARCRAAEPIIKESNMLDYVAVPVPGEIRAWRDRLGFDYGKFDYVCPEGQPVLLDINRTPGVSAKLIDDPEIRANLDSLKEGLSMFLP